MLGRSQGPISTIAKPRSMPDQTRSSTTSWPRQFLAFRPSAKLQRRRDLDLAYGEGMRVMSSIYEFSAEDINKIKGKKSAEIKKILPESDFDEVVHKDNLVIL